MLTWWGTHVIHQIIPGLHPGAQGWGGEAVHLLRVYMWRPEDNFQELALSFHHVDLGD